MNGDKKTDVTVDAVAARVEKLERQNRWLLWGIAALALALTLLVAVAATQPQATEELLRAKRFELVDDEGNLRVALGNIMHRSPGLQLYDEEHQLRASLSMFEDGTTGLRVYGDETSAELVAVPGGGIGLWLHKQQGQLLAGLYSFPEGTSFSLSDCEGSPRFVIGGKGEGEIVLALLKDRKSRAELLLGADGSPSLRFLDDNGQTVFSAP